VEQLFSRDLRPGDLMLQAHSGAATSRIIEWAQRKAHQLNSQVVHAGVLFDNNFMVEALRHGIQASDLRVQNASYGYIVYRPRSDELARRAAKCAKAMFEINQRQKNLAYPLPHKMAGSLSANSGTAPDADEMTKLFRRIGDGAKQPFFCSHFVAFVYQYAGELAGINPAAIFAANAARVSPSTLASLLQSNSYFAEAGYVMPGERLKQAGA
jgi:hypothetical protein